MFDDATAVIIKSIAFFGGIEDERFMDVGYCKRCKDFDPAKEDPVVFFRNLLDMCVYTSGCSDRTVWTMRTILEEIPESDDDRDRRRLALEKVMKP